jgi:hypothetical protein
MVNFLPQMPTPPAAAPQWPVALLPVCSQFLRPSIIDRIPFSTQWLSTSIRPSPKITFSPGRNLSASWRAFARKLSGSALAGADRQPVQLPQKAQRSATHVASPMSKTGGLRAWPRALRVRVPQRPEPAAPPKGTGKENA